MRTFFEQFCCIDVQNSVQALPFVIVVHREDKKVPTGNYFANSSRLMIDEYGIVPAGTIPYYGTIPAGTGTDWYLLDGTTSTGTIQQGGLVVSSMMYL